MLLVGVAVVCADVVVDVGGVVIGVVGISAAVFDANVGAAGIAANVDVDVGGGAVVLDVTVAIVVNVGADVVSPFITLSFQFLGSPLILTSLLPSGNTPKQGSLNPNSLSANASS